jgi:hypothetical protein
LWASNYSLAAPTDNLTRPFVANTYQKSSLEIEKTEMVDLLKDIPTIDEKYVESFTYSPEVDVKEVVLGFWHGLNERVLRKSERTGIEYSTAALYMKLNKEYYHDAYKYMLKIHEQNPQKLERIREISPDDLELRSTVLHSLSHAILSKIPIYTGLGLDNFGYLYDVQDDSVLIYEQAKGGLGACYVLTEKDEESGELIVHDFISEIRNTITDCNCDDCCKYCLAVAGCQEFNSKLDRFLLGPLFRIPLDDLSWGL